MEYAKPGLVNATVAQKVGVLNTGTKHSEQKLGNKNLGTKYLGTKYSEQKCMESTQGVPYTCDNQKNVHPEALQRMCTPRSYIGAGILSEMREETCSRSISSSMPKMPKVLLCFWWDLPPVC